MQKSKIVLIIVIVSFLFIIISDWFYDKYTFQTPILIKLQTPIYKKQADTIFPSPQSHKNTPKRRGKPKEVAKPTTLAPFPKFLTDQGAKNREWVLNYVKYKGDQLIAFDNLLKKEAGYRPDAVNEIGAGGIGQAYPASKMNCPLTQEGLRCQTDWVQTYIKNRYGSPLMAWNFHEQNNWY